MVDFVPIPVEFVECIAKKPRWLLPSNLLIQTFVFVQANKSGNLFDFQNPFISLNVTKTRMLATDCLMMKLWKVSFRNKATVVQFNNLFNESSLLETLKRFPHQHFLCSRQVEKLIQLEINIQIFYSKQTN